MVTSCTIAQVSSISDDKSALVQVMDRAVRQLAITWVKVDPDIYRHVASLELNELSRFRIYIYIYF